MNTLSEVQDNGFVQFVFDNANHNTRIVEGHVTFHVMGGVQCVTPVSAVQTCSCIPPWIGARLCPKGGGLFARQGAQPAVRGDECNEIGLKLSLEYYLSTTVEYPVQKFSPSWGPGPPFPTLAPSLIPRQKIILTANIAGKFGFIPIVTHDWDEFWWPKNHVLNRLVMEGVLSLKVRSMDAKIGTIYHWIWTAGPKSSEEPHTGWNGFMKNVAGKR
ncbi:hypothetical protein AVEN_221430-1 [Araneus ventricosus]|uniref:Uncharacterized protein n=1 Tax=Araneus ventricosus TaxID=182803 RepID=A0A4Y2MQT9_ARAVE|nr:hypothetical protein AVEN_221430-1 [Araneus ventricosus]